MRRSSAETVLPLPAMNISIFSHVDADIAFIARSLPAHDCHGVKQRADVRRAHPHLLIVDVASAGAHLAEIVQIAQTQAPPIPVLLLAGDTPQELAQIDGTIETEFKPLRRHAVAARVRLLLRRAYPEHDERQIQRFGDYAFESPAHVVIHAGRNVALTQKEFALAILLFGNLGRPLSRVYLQETVWGQEDENEVPTRTIDTHISRVRSKLRLKPENGFRLSTVYGYGYQLERLDAPPLKK
ncbi:response regulator transcription factor [Herbaspirillum sp. RV1423]|uniref:DNA-binding response regulator n=1 Tax=Herbaspirillum sp. RV1423 TaxID=1443993 RepID=UPI0012DF56DF|nr:response regulator transcription factor [Herbaspirillum sp. RV1423]